MKFASSWRFSIALVAIGLLVAFAALPSGPRSAEANVASVDPETFLVEDGDVIDVDISGDAGAGVTLTVSVTGDSTLDNSDAGCTDDEGPGGCGTSSGSGTDSVMWDDVAGEYDATVELTASCDEPESVTITADDEGTPRSETIYCVPDLDDPQVIVEKESNDSRGYDFDWDSSGGDCLVSADDGTLELDGAGGFELGDNDEAFFYCENSTDFLVVEEQDDDFFVEIDGCDEGDEGVDEIDGASVDFDIGDLETGDTVSCTWVNDEDFEPEDEVGPATSVRILLSDAAIDCGGSTLVQVVPRSSGGGPVSAGTTVSLTSSLGGTFQPASSITSVFPIALANFLYTAPDDADGTTTITARVGNVQATAIVRIVCEVSPATPTPAPLAPPSAGSGGLAGGSGGGGSYLPLALAVAAVAIAGIAARTRRFATASAGVAEASPPKADISSQRTGSFALLASFLMLIAALLAKRWL